MGGGGQETRIERIKRERKENKERVVHPKMYHKGFKYCTSGRDSGIAKCSWVRGANYLSCIGC